MSSRILPYWLPAPSDLSASFRSISSAPPGSDRLAKIVAVAEHALDFVQCGKLDRQLQLTLADLPGLPGTLEEVRVAWLGFSTIEHLVPSARIAGLRRGIVMRSYVAPYGQARQELFASDSGLVQFEPHVVLLCLDHQHGLPVPHVLASRAEVNAAVESSVSELSQLWARVTRDLHAVLVQQTIPNLAPSIFGSLDAAVPATRRSVIDCFNQRIRERASEEGVQLLDLAFFSARLGQDTWFDPVRWLHAKQLVSPALAPLFGEYFARVVGAVRGRARKCLILDLDNTLWGGVVGDDGVERLELGHGRASGEGFSNFQAYVALLRERGVVLAVCSKNDDHVARAAFEKHPEMLLKLEDITVFVANWQDKATNIRHIAETLNLGLDAMVFVDDNPVERALVRAELPAVAVPEMPTDSAYFVRTLEDAGYFESVAFTEADQSRTKQYADNSKRSQALQSATDMAGFLRGLSMKMEGRRIEPADLPRVTQLINKTNQFNLTTRRYAEPEVAAIVADPNCISLQFRLLDRFGDNGCIGVILGILEPGAGPRRLRIDIFLMSCRVLGRGAEQAMLNVLLRHVATRGIDEVVGEYLPTPKNGMVVDLYPRLGFEALPQQVNSAGTSWRLRVGAYQEHLTFIEINEP